jgi:mRNA-degrading endonuclease toxin of MazEF toxin-antitoxin module
VLRRGDVVEVRAPRIGFARDAGRQLVLILQRDEGNALLPTTVVAPLDRDYDPRAPHPFDVVVPEAELGAGGDHAAHLHLLSRCPRDRLGERVGAAGKRTMADVTRRLRLLLG